jgi:hypothetical protein
VKITRALVLAVALAITGIATPGCHKSLDGNYRDDASIFFVEFKPDGKALLKLAGDTREANYTLDGNKVTITSANGTIVLTINGDGSLSGDPTLGTLKKRS